MTMSMGKQEQDANLLAEVQRDALDPKVALADTLRKVVTLGGAVGSDELREWASLELRGYVGSSVELPNYRKIPAPIEIDGFAGAMQATGHRISRRSLPDFARDDVDEEVPLTNSVGELAAMVQQAESQGGHLKLSLPMGQDLVAVMNSKGDGPLAVITSLYWSVSGAAVAGALDRIRTTLVELVAEMRAITPASAEVPSGDAVDRAVNVVIYGGHVNLTTAWASGSGSHNVSAEGTYVETNQVEAAWPGLHDELAELGVAQDELDALHAALLSDGDPTGKELGPEASSWLGRFSAKVASQAAVLAGTATIDDLVRTLLKAFGAG
jgi:hypothetical protein